MEDSDTEEPKAAEDHQEIDTFNNANEPSSGNDGGSSENTGFEIGSSSHQSSSSSGGVMKDPTNGTQQGNNNA